ncbi:hypothetical protein [Thermomicrobium sp.]
MQDAKHSKPLTIRPLVLLSSIAAFLVVYLGGILRGQSLLWVAVSSASALVLMLIAGLVIERLLASPSEADEAAAIYERSPARSDQRETS